jgi:hypothetical protein
VAAGLIGPRGRRGLKKSSFSADFRYRNSSGAACTVEGINLSDARLELIRLGRGRHKSPRIYHSQSDYSLKASHVFVSMADLRFSPRKTAAFDFRATLKYQIYYFWVKNKPRR